MAPDSRIYQGSFWSVLKCLLRSPWASCIKTKFLWFLPLQQPLREFTDRLLVLPSGFALPYRNKFFFQQYQCAFDFKNTHTKPVDKRAPPTNQNKTQISNWTKKTQLPCTHSLQMGRSSIGSELNQNRRQCQLPSGLMFPGHTWTETWLDVTWTVKSSCFS